MTRLHVFISYRQTSNYEGFASYQRPLKKQYLQMLLTNTLSNTFYASSQSLLRDAHNLHLTMSQHDPDYTARALVYARQKGLMRAQPLLGLAYLNAADPKAFERIFAQVVLTPNDLYDVVTTLRSGKLPRGYTRRAKRAATAWLQTLSEYHAIKYSKKLCEVLRQTHPKPNSARQSALFTWIDDPQAWRNACHDELTPQIAAFETFKAAAKARDEARMIAAIREGKLPHDVVTGALPPSTAVWHALLNNLPYLALLRHLNTLQRVNVLNTRARFIANRLSDVEAMHKARVLPFQILQAYRAFRAENTRQEVIYSALESVIDSACDNLPPLAGRVCIAPDISGSMLGSAQGSMTRYIDIAGLFAAALLRLSSDSLVLPFNHAVAKITLDRHASVLYSTEAIAAHCNGGTALSAPISALIAARQVVDTFIGITDNEEWGVDSYGNHGFWQTWQTYKKQVAPHAKAFLLTLAPYNHAVAPAKAQDVYFIYGWSEQVLSYISLMSAGMHHQLDE